jgi:hypothetical protein
MIFFTRDYRLFLSYFFIHVKGFLKKYEDHPIYFFIIGRFGSERAISPFAQKIHIFKKLAISWLEPWFVFLRGRQGGPSSIF